MMSMRKRLNDEFIDYDGPTGLYVATDDGPLPLATPEALEAMGHSAMLLSLGCSPEAAEYERLVKEHTQRLRELRSAGSSDAAA
jgi:hypothetical protein